MNLTTAQFQRLEQLFAEALDLSPPFRNAFLAGIRKEEGGELADHLEALLAAQSEQTESIFQLAVGSGIALSPTRFSFHEGELLLNRFRIIRLLGRGGMGEVYQAQDSEMGPIALKTVREDVRRDRSLLQRFKQEVQLARAVTSPHVCRIHELFTLPAQEDRPSMAFLTMELLEGSTLADRIAQQGPLPWREAESIAIQLCEGLGAIHRAGIIHRDLKSRNVMLATKDGESRAVVMDLGLAHRQETGETPGQPRTPITLAGVIMGTPEYMAPEQFENGALTAATDIYAFGIVLYEMATGKLPFQASTPLASAVRRAKRPPSVSSVQRGVPHRWDVVIGKCLDYEPARRYASAADVSVALRRSPALSALTGNAHARRRLAVVMACLALLITFGWVFQEYRLRTEHKVPEAAQAFYREATDAFHNANYLTAARQLQQSIKLDPDFTLAHARLADALNELDSTGEAQREVNQIKQELVNQLPPAEQTYVEAVRDAVRPDPKEAVTEYEKLLQFAGTENKVNALVDLGRANERAGKIGEAMRNYNEAIRLAAYAPAPLLRRGILASRQGEQRDADRDFAAAAKIYSMNIDQEGTAEVDYQRSYVASKLGPGHEKEARAFFQASLEAAKTMQSVALQVRAMSRLSAIEFGAAHDEEAGKVAEQAIQLAEENGIAYWATDARLRQGLSYTFTDHNKASEILERARKEAERNQWPRLLALGQISLANLALQHQELPRQQEVINLAGPAYEYYRTFGFAQESFQCQVMLSRAKSFLGLFAESLQHARKALELAGTLASSTDQLQAQEALGTALLWKQEYSAALGPLTAALHMAERMPKEQRDYYSSVEALLLAEAFCGLGQSAQAKQVLAAIPAATWQRDRHANLRFILVQAKMLLNQGNDREALRLIEGSVEKAAASGEDSDLVLIAAECFTRIGYPARAMALCDRMLQSPRKEGPVLLAEAKIEQSRARLALRQWVPATALAAETERVFAGFGAQESELVSFSLLLRSFRGAGLSAEAVATAGKIRNLLAAIKTSYGDDNFRSFIGRSEIAEVISSAESIGSQN